MSTATVLEFLLHSAENRAQEPRRPDTFGPVPELPRPSQRWTVRRKAAVVEAVRGGWMPIEEACESLQHLGRRVSRLGTRSRPLWHPWSAHHAISDLSRYRQARSRRDRHGDVS